MFSTAIHELYEKPMIQNCIVIVMETRDLQH